MTFDKAKSIINLGEMQETGGICMQFVKTDDLKVGMRLARPIYNKNGVLLYERDSKLTMQGIISIKNFNLIGIYILEPAEPVPPMTADDLFFERFQTMEVFAIRDELSIIQKTGKLKSMPSIVLEIIKNYGKLDRRISFSQNLRSKSDAHYKHTLNVAILTALISNQLGVSNEEQQTAISVALIHEAEQIFREEKIQIDMAQFLECAFPGNPNVRRIYWQMNSAIKEIEENRRISIPLLNISKILVVAHYYDTMTAMKYQEAPKSEVEALRFFMNNATIFNARIVEALIQSIHILAPGTCVELTDGEKGVIIHRNEKDVLQPILLKFSNNEIIDLSNDLVYRDIHMKDIMKTMDNRYIMDETILQQYGRGNE